MCVRYSNSDSDIFTFNDLPSILRYEYKKDFNKQKDSDYFPYKRLIHFSMILYYVYGSYISFSEYRNYIYYMFLIGSEDVVREENYTSVSLFSEAITSRCNPRTSRGNSWHPIKTRH